MIENAAIYTTIKREELPQNILSKMNETNVFYTEAFCLKQKQNGCVPLYFYNGHYMWVIFLRNKMFFRWCIVPTEYICYQEEKEESAISFLNDVMGQLKKVYKVQWLAQTEPQTMFEVCPDNSRAIRFGNYVIDLQKSEEELWNGLHSKHRNVIRKAQKENLTVEDGYTEKMLNEFIEMDNQTWARSGLTGHGTNYYKEIMDTLPENARFYIVYKEKIPQGGILLFYNQTRCYYMYGASKNNPFTGAMNYLHWYAMLDMKKKRVKEYSFVGCRINEDANSKYHTIQRFKERFGGDLKESVMFKYIISKPMYRLYCTLKYVRENHGKPYPIDIVEQEYIKWNR